MMTPGTVVISLDLELCWGEFDLSYDDDLLKMARWTHDIGARRLLNHLTSNGLSATWAVVGAMMCPSLLDVRQVPEVRFRHFSKPWFSCVPKQRDEATHPEWFGPSLVEMIRDAKPEQEIGFHSFSHVPFGIPGMTLERAVAEYQYCSQTARGLGIPAKTFVFPRNLVGYLRELRNAGFNCFRDVDNVNFSFANAKLRSVGMIWADLLGLTPRMVEPSLKEDLVSIPGSLAIRYERGWRKYIPDASRLRRLRKGLERVRQEGGVFHIWFHPENLYFEWPRLENVVARFLEELGNSVCKGEVRCLTMAQLATEFRTRLAVSRRECHTSPTVSPTTAAQDAA